MDLICPECRQILEVADAQNAVCSAHDGRFEVLFDRGRGFAAEIAQPAPVVAAAAPATTAYEIETKPCESCGVLNPISAAFCRACRAKFSLLSMTFTPRPGPSMDNIFCTQHPGVQAVTRCQVCYSGVCVTCDFALPGGAHVCPACIEKEPSHEISPARRKKMVAGLIIATYSTLMFVLGRTGVLVRTFGNDKETIAVLGMLIFWPMVIGVAVSVMALDKRLGNSTAIWVGVVWNSINLALLLLLRIVQVLG